MIEAFCPLDFVSQPRENLILEIKNGGDTMNTIKEIQLSSKNRGSIRHELITTDGDSCGNGGRLFVIRYNVLNSIASVVVSSLNKSTGASKRIDLHVTGGSENAVSVGCNRNSAGEPIQHDIVWSLGSDTYTPQNLNDPWACLVYLKSAAPFGNTRYIFNGHARRILVTLTRPNGLNENHVLDQTERRLIDGEVITHAEFFGV